VLKRLITYAYYYAGGPYVRQLAGRRGARVLIVYYHAIHDVWRGLFQDHLEYLCGFCRIVSLGEAVEAMQHGRAERLGVITFDDGLECLRDNAFPVLRERRIPATVFVPTDLCGTVPPWFRATTRRERAMFTVMALEELRAEQDDIIQFQAHSASHADLFRMTEDELDADFRRNRDTLADALGTDVWAICYPRGQFDDTIVRVARRHFRVGLTSLPGIDQPADLMRLRRVDLSGGIPLAEVRRRLRGSTEWSRSLLERRMRRRARELHETR